MTSSEWEDICISFDEYGMHPTTLCDNADEVINNFKKAFKDVFKDLGDYENLKNLMGTPIQDIMKRLKVLDIIQAKAINYGECVCIDSLFYDEEVKEWCK